MWNMKILTKTPQKVVIQVETTKMNEVGFDVVWDEIRQEFPEDKFCLKNIDKDTDDNIFFELKQISIKRIGKTTKHL